MSIFLKRISKLYSKVFTLEQVQGDARLIGQLYKYLQFKSRQMGENIDLKEIQRTWNAMIRKNDGEHLNLNKWWIVVFNEEDQVVGFKILRTFNFFASAHWAISEVNFHNTQKILDWSKPHPWKVALDATAKLMIEQRVYDLYSMQAYRPAHKKLWSSGKDALRFCSEWYDEEKQQYKWHIFHEGIIPADTEHPNASVFQNVMFGRTRNFPVTVRRFTLKNEYRPDWHEVSDWWLNDNK